MLFFNAIKFDIIILMHMEVLIDGKAYKVNIIRKNNRNTYLRVKSDLQIYITTNYLMPNFEIERFIRSNISSIKKMIDRQEKKKDKSESFYYLGKKYDIVICNTIKKVTFDDDHVFINDKKKLDKFLKDETLKIFEERLKYNYNKFEENIPYPILKIRKMKAKWGYNRKPGNIVMLNSELIKYSIDEIDYVIVHELCHFLEFNHSRSFWNYVKKYKPNYKENKKILKE